MCNYGFLHRILLALGGHTHSEEKVWDTFVCAYFEDNEESGQGIL